VIAQKPYQSYVEDISDPFIAASISAIDWRLPIDCRYTCGYEWITDILHVGLNLTNPPQ
jgi:hypothetical protein